MDYVVVDTDVVSFLFKGDTRASLYRRHLEGKIPAVSFMTVAELLRWSYKKNWGERRIRQLEERLRNYVVLPYDVEVSRWWARIQTEREKNGRPISTADAWVASSAMRHGYPLITHNRGDFEGIDGLVLISEAS